jgi:[acyl-carrier-protein] S-malonyltransferase
MIARARRMGAAALAVCDRARMVMGGALADRYLGVEVRLECNRDIQISVFITTQMHLAALNDAGFDADVSLGLSLGEYSHLVHIGALTFEQALALVETRGALYDRAAPGIMVSISGLEEDEVAAAVQECSSEGTIVISNYNSPMQHVLAGEAAAVRRAAHLLEEGGAAVVQIEARVPMHSPLLDPVAVEFRGSLARMPWRAPSRAYIPNVTGDPIAGARPADFVDALTAHVSRPVLWRRSIEQVAAACPGAPFVEVGPGHVLHNLLSRRWLAVPRFATDNALDDGTADWRNALEALVAGA